MSQVTPAHTQQVTLRITEAYPAHEARESDPHYKYFKAARARLVALGAMKCWICGATEHVELHHTMVEFALANGVDVSKFETLYPEFGITSDEEFLRWVEQDEHNLTPLCRLHHTGILGVHVLPNPIWLAQRFWRDDIPVPGRICEPEAEAA